MNAYKTASYVGFIFIIIGIVLLVYGASNFLDEYKLNSVGIKTKGKVIELSSTPPYRQAIVQFKTKSGQTINFLDKLFWNNQFKTYVVGQEVEVIYDPSNPYQTATINSFFQRNVGPWWPAILAFIAIITGIIWIRGFSKKAKRWEGQMNGTIAVNPYDYRRSSNKVGLILVIVIVILILILVIPFWLTSK